MTRVETGSRLHFGLLGPPPIDGRRGYGGCGLMIDAPAVRVAVEPAAEWSAVGPAAERALAVARRVAADRPHRIVVESCPPQHVGLGAGTQLSLAVGRAILHLAPGDSPGANYMARLTGRGARSGIGVHGFERGGFLVDAGKRAEDSLAPLAVRADFPPEWRVIVLIPPATDTWHGDRERGVFAALNGIEPDHRLCRLLLMGVLPALAERDLDAFGDALFEYNVRAGEPFRTAQGGPFAPQTAEMISWLRTQAVRAAGQSSWGPTAFAVVSDLDRAEMLINEARRRWPSVEVTATRGRNRGAAASAN